ncbi:MAG: hypothetical protein KBC90_18980 [Spirochaetes bacterium]|nr:hypothetical protein [Spirochaetota bacterium]
MSRRSARTALFLTAVPFMLLVFHAPCWARSVGDGFHLAKTMKSRYFTIQSEEGANLDRLEAAVTVPPVLRAIIRTGIQEVDGKGFPSQADLTFLAVSEILGMRIKSFQSSIKIAKDGDGLERVAQRLFGRRIRTGGFYVVALDSLYMDAQNASLYIFGHELAHAVIVKYFVVPPPEKIQEVLAGFVEYEMRKRMKTLGPVSSPVVR